MTDRGLPIVDGAPACPFVAFDDDRDGRATGPDHRHRCYAEIRPAPRALAHQEAYCLSSAFAVCPTFQDWARREAAAARGPGRTDADGSAARDRAASPDVEPGAPLPGPPGGLSERNPPRDWAAPPPWLSEDDDVDPDEDRDVPISPPARGGGLAGSFADQVASGGGGRRSSAAPSASGSAVPPADPGRERRREVAPPPAFDAIGIGDPAADPDAEDPPTPRPGGGAPVPRRGSGPALRGPAWERPKRMEAYPTLRTRMGLPAISLSPILVGVAALVIAAVVLFYLPALLSIGGGSGPTPSPTTGAGASASVAPTLAEPTPVPAPTPQTYVVQAGDTMSKIANRFGVPLATLVDANRDTIPNPDVLQIGQEVIIPVVAPTTVPDAGSPSP